MKDSEIVRLACIYAEQDRESFIAAYEHMQDDPACVEALKYLKALRHYQAKRWGKPKRSPLNTST